jgi:PAS domain S-box-containing protein
LDDGANLAERIIEGVADAVIFADRAGTIRRFNPAAAALFGFSAEEALGQSLDLIIPELCAPRTGAALTRRWRTAS